MNQTLGVKASFLSETTLAMIHAACCLGSTCYADGLLAKMTQLGSSYLVFFTLNTVAAAILVIGARPWSNADVIYHEELLLWMQTEEKATASNAGDDDGNDSLMGSLAVESFEGADTEWRNGTEQAVDDEHDHEYVTDADDLEKRSEEFIAKMFNRWKEERLII